VDVVLSEMAALGLRGTELGAPGFLPSDSAALRRELQRHRLALVGGFVPLVLHEARPDGTMNTAREAARLFSDAGGEVLVLALVQDVDWAAPRRLDDEDWQRLAANIGELEALAAEYGIKVALHPHAGTLVQNAEEVERALEVLDVDWCLDTGHLAIGGVDPASFARKHGNRVAHVHLKDVDGSLAAELREGRSSLLDATRKGLFLPLGKGDAGIREVLDALDAHGYDGWLVLEQDTAITGDEPTVASGPTRDARASIAFILDTARTSSSTT
jgi:inosose dehydratase